MSKTKKIIYIIIAIIIFILAVQVLAADRYQAVVKVIEGEGKVGINPTAEKLDFGDLSKNTQATRYISIENNGRWSVYIMVWKFGEIAELIKVNRNYFTLESGQKERLAFELYMPVSADKEGYAGRVWVFKLPRP